MQKIYLSRRNLEVLLAKLDRTKKGDKSACSIVKHDTLHAKYPCSDVTTVIAVENEEYYDDRAPGTMHEKEDGIGRRAS